MDPVFHGVARIATALLFAVAAYHKASDFQRFCATLRDYQILPAKLAGPFALGLIATESLVAVGFVLSPGFGTSAIATSLLIAYSAAIGINLHRGRRHIDCGCLGPGQTQPLSAFLLLRNALLVPLCIVAALPPAPRALGWIDAVSVGGGVVALGLLFVAANELGARPSLASASRRSP